MGAVELRGKKSMQWISVGERLPEQEETVLVWADGSFYSGEYWADGGRWVRSSDFLTIEGVTHWAEVKGPEEE